MQTKKDFQLTALALRRTRQYVKAVYAGTDKQAAIEDVLNGFEREICLLLAGANPNFSTTIFLEESGHGSD